MPASEDEIKRLQREVTYAIRREAAAEARRGRLSTELNEAALVAAEAHRDRERAEFALREAVCTA